MDRAPRAPIPRATDRLTSAASTYARGRRTVTDFQEVVAAEGPSCRGRRTVTDIQEVVAAEGPSRGVAAGRSAQRGTSGAATGGGGLQAPPNRTRYSAQAPPTRTRYSAQASSTRTREEQRTRSAPPTWTRYRALSFLKAAATR